MLTTLAAGFAFLLFIFIRQALRAELDRHELRQEASAQLVGILAHRCHGNPRLIEEMARWDKEGRKFPATILCPHENTAMHMAAGYAMVTGKGQAVMVHVDAGTSNTAMGMHNARRCHTPLLLMAGKAPYTVRGELAGSRDNYVHFVQEPFDQGSIVRNYAKWEWTLPSGVITKEVLRRAHSVAHSDPQGPTYLMLPRETLAQEWDDSQVASFPAEQYGPAKAGAAAGSDADTGNRRRQAGQAAPWRHPRRTDG